MLLHPNIVELFQSVPLGLNGNSVQSSIAIFVFIPFCLAGIFCFRIILIWYSHNTKCAVEKYVSKSCKPKNFKYAPINKAYRQAQKFNFLTCTTTNIVLAIFILRELRCRIKYSYCTPMPTRSMYLLRVILMEKLNFGVKNIIFYVFYGLNTVYKISTKLA